MPPISFVFERLIEEIEKRVDRAVANGEIEENPVMGPDIVTRARDAVFGEPNTREVLVIMSSIGNIDEYEMDTRGMDAVNEVSVIVRTCLYAVIEQRLATLAADVAAVSFAAGFAPVAERIVSLAETAVESFPSSKWVSVDAVAETRKSLERVLDRNGELSDLETVLRSTELLRGLLMSPKDRIAWQRHGLDYETVLAAKASFKPYKAMLGLGWNNAPAALAAISNRAASELRPAATPTDNAATAGPKP